MFISKKKKQYIDTCLRELQERVRVLEQANRIPDYRFSLMSHRHFTLKQVIYALLEYLKVEITTVGEVAEKTVLKKLTTKKGN